MAEQDYVLGKILIKKEDIARRTEEIASEIAARFRGERLIAVCILKGASIFMADLVRAIGPDVDVRMDFMAVSSYGLSQSSSGAVKILKDMDTPAEGTNVLIVEDIMDTGLTLSYLQEVIGGRHPKSISTAVLLEKPDRRKADCRADWIGFTIPDKFVVGCGLDYAGKWRCLPDIWTVEQK